MSLERVWRISKVTHSSFPKKKQLKKTYEFGENLENLQTQSKLLPLVQKNIYIEKKMTTEKMKTYEFGARTVRLFQTNMKNNNRGKTL